MSWFVRSVKNRTEFFQKTEFSVIVCWHTISGLNFQKPNFLKTKKTEPISRLKPNAQAYEGRPRGSMQRFAGRVWDDTWRAGGATKLEEMRGLKSLHYSILNKKGILAPLIPSGFWTLKLAQMEIFSLKHSRDI
jgi:hypothetical protein